MLTYDQLQCIGAVIAATQRFPRLLAAVDAELEQAKKDQPTCPAPQEGIEVDG